MNKLRAKFKRKSGVNNNLITLYCDILFISEYREDNIDFQLPYRYFRALIVGGPLQLAI